jgi:hypothetical protein
MHMPQFTSPRPALSAQAGALRKPCNPMVAPAQFRQAGRHQTQPPRQRAQQQLRQSLHELIDRPPSQD